MKKWKIALICVAVALACVVVGVTVGVVSCKSRAKNTHSYTTVTGDNNHPNNNSIDETPDDKVIAAIEKFLFDIATVKAEKAGKYAINKADFEALIAEYENTEFTSETTVDDVTALYAEFEDKLSEILTDEDIIEEYAAGKSEYILDYETKTIKELEDEDLEETIADEKQAAIATLTCGIMEADGYAHPASENYYITVIDARVAAVCSSIDGKLEAARRLIEEVKRDAEITFQEFVLDTLSKIKDSAFAEELSKDPEAPAIDLSECKKAGAVIKELYRAQSAYLDWLDERLDKKLYKITVQGTIGGADSGSPAIIEVKYGSSLSLEDLPDPAESIDNLMIDPDDAHYFTEKPLDTDRTFKGADEVYFNLILYVKLVKAVLVAREEYSFNYGSLADAYGFSESGTPLTAGVMKGEGNDFLTVTDDTSVIWRDSNAGFIENKDDGLILAFSAGGKLIVKASSTGISDTSRFGIKDSSGFWLLPTAITGIATRVETAQSTDSESEIGSYSISNTTAVTFEYTITKTGVYTISCPSKVTNCGARLLSIVQVVDAHKVKAIAVSEITLQQTADLASGKSVKLNLKIEPATAFYQAVWSSDNGDITVDGRGVVTAAETAVAGQTATIKVKVTDVFDNGFDGECTVRITDEKKVIVLYLKDLVTTSMQTWNNGWEDDTSVVMWSSAYFKNSYDFDVKYNNGTEDTSDDIIPVIAQAGTDTYVQFALIKAAAVTVYYTYNYADSSTEGFSIDGKECDWPAVSAAGEVAAKELGIMDAGIYKLERKGEIGFCYIVFKEV